MDRLANCKFAIGARGLISALFWILPNSVAASG